MRPDLGLFVVADGAGGHNAGNVASTLAVTTIGHAMEQSAGAAASRPTFDRLGLQSQARRLSAAVHEANKEILQIAKGSDRHSGMATTVVAALLHPARDTIHIAWVGDSRCYRLRDGRFEQLTVDHNFTHDVLEMKPDIDDEGVLKLPSNVVTRALGMTGQLRVSVRSHAVCDGDRFLLCSDGLSDVVSAAQLGDLLGADSSCEERTALLKQLALACAAGDNIAVIVVDSHAGEPQPARASRSEPPRPRDRLDSIREDDDLAAEIVHYRPSEQGAPPNVAVVPREGSSPDLMAAVYDLIDEPPTRPCPACGTLIGAKAAYCGHCGAGVERPAST